MTFSIGNRLFLAMLLAFLTLALLGLGLVRWRLLDGVAVHSTDTEMDRLADLNRALSARYRQQANWSFLPTTPELRASWLRQTLAELQNGPTGDAALPSALPGLGYRIGLLDSDGHTLAGAIAHPLIKAFASIDTVRRAIVVDGKTVGYLVVAKPESPADELAVAFLMQQQHNLAIVAVIGLVLSALLAALLPAQFRRPIRQLVAVARRLGAAQFDARVPTTRRDELGELGLAFNQLAARLQDAEQSRRQWIADTSHELRTPLAVMRAQIEAMQDGVRPANPDNMTLVLKQLLALSALVDDLYELARADVGQLAYRMTTHDVWRIVCEATDSFTEKLRAASLSLTLAAAPARSNVRCDPDRLRQVLNNLLLNCVRHTDAGGRVGVSARVEGDALHILIDDSAPGVPDDALAHLGERFFRVDTSRSRQRGGAGLGLALCKMILHAHAGQLEFSPSPWGGLRVALVLQLES